MSDEFPEAKREHLMLHDAAPAGAIVFGVKLSCKYAFEVSPVTVSLFDVAAKLKN